MSVSGDCLVLTIKDKCGQCGCDNLCDPECMPYTANTDEMTENESQRKNQDNISQAGDKQGFHTFSHSFQSTGSDNRDTGDGKSDADDAKCLSAGSNCSGIVTE